jgi:putative addiction module component (TIGR02574 family)
MSERAAKLLKELLTLPVEDRQFIADRLDEDLVDRLGEPPFKYESEDEFYAEIERRSNLAHEHPEQLIGGEQFMIELKARFAN